MNLAQARLLAALAELDATLREAAAFEEDPPAAWLAQAAERLALAVAVVDEAFTGRKRLRDAASDRADLRDLLIGEQFHWEVYLSDGGYSRFVLHNPMGSRERVTMHFDPNLAGPRAKVVWAELVATGHATPGGRFNLSP